MKKLFKRSIPLFLVLMSLVLLSACGSDSKTYDAQINDFAETVEKEYASDTALGESAIADVPQNSKIIRNAVIDGETKDFDSAVESVKNKISELEGYVEESDLYGGESLYNGTKSARRAEFIIRIPADALDKFLENTQGLLNITSSSESTTDVTLDYYDIQSRLDTLKTKKTALEAMLEKAETLDDMLVIQDNLYDVIADIEAYQSKLNVYDNKVNYSTVTLTIIEVVEYTVTEEQSFGERINTAFKESWENFGEFCQDFAVFVVAALPVLMFPAIAGVIILIIMYTQKKKSKKSDKNSSDKETKE